jgi:hypothetical protein
MTDQQQLPEDETQPTIGPHDDSRAGGDGADGEFRLTVRKLELPVRPRGVLAE